jgi:hypothetical protein
MTAESSARPVGLVDHCPELAQRCPPHLRDHPFAVAIHASHDTTTSTGFRSQFASSPGSPTRGHLQRGNESFQDIFSRMGRLRARRWWARPGADRGDKIAVERTDWPRDAIRESVLLSEFAFHALWTLHPGSTIPTATFLSPGNCPVQRRRFPDSRPPAVERLREIRTMIWSPPPEEIVAFDINRTDLMNRCTDSHRLLWPASCQFLGVGASGPPWR